MRIRWTSAAVTDLENIGQYLKERHPTLAQPTVERLYDAAQSLTKFPYRSRAGQLPGTRELVTAPLPYIIVHQVSDPVIHILRILHGAQDWPGRAAKREY